MTRFIHTYSNLLAQYKGLWLLAVLGVTVALCSQLIYFSINPTPYFLDRSHPSRVAQSLTNETFTNTGEAVFMVVEAQTGNIFNTQSLTLIKKLTLAIEAISLVDEKDKQLLKDLSQTHPPLADQFEHLLVEGITLADRYPLQQLLSTNQAILSFDDKRYLNDLLARLSPIKKVRSLATLSDLQTYTEEGEEVLDSFSLMDEVPDAKEALQALEALVNSNPIFTNLVIGGSDTQPMSASSIQIELALDDQDSPNMITLYAKLNALIERFQGQDPIYFAGPPMVTAQTADSMASNNERLMPYVILVVLIILLISFRNLQGVFIPLAVAIITCLWTLSVMAICRIPQNIITTALPVFIISIAIADAIHFLSAYYQARAKKSAKEAITDTFTELNAPLLITTITTIVGFLAVSNTEIVFMKEFGWFVAVGIAFAYLLTITLVPLLLLFFDKTPSKNTASRVQLHDLAGNFFIKLTHLIQQHRLPFTLSFVVLFIGAGYGLKHLVVDNQVIGNFAKDAPIRIADEKINQRFGGTTPFSVTLRSKEPDAFKSPTLLQAIDEIQTTLRAHSDVGYSLSLVDFVKRAYQQQENQPFSLPDTQSSSVIAQYLFLYENSEDQELRDVVNLSYDQTRIIFTLNTDKSSDIDGILALLRQQLDQQLPKGISYDITGFAELLATSTEEIVINQFSNNFIALGSIFIILLILLRSLPQAIISMIPLISTVFLIFSLMAVTNIPLDIGTALISCITFGVGIDYAIHFIVILRQVNHQDIALQAAIDKTLKHVSAPILINSISLAAGLLVTTTTDYKPIIHLGLIISLAMVICAFITLILLPLLVSLTQPTAALITKKQA